MKPSYGGLADRPVAILGGTGALGYGLALRLAEAGTPVVIGSRDEARAREAAERVRASVERAQVRGVENPEAVDPAGSLVVLTVPFDSQLATLGAVADRLTENHVVLDATVPLATAVGGKPTQLIGVWEGSAGERAAAAVPRGTVVVSGLHTVSAHALTTLGEPLGQSTLLCGDVRPAKELVAEVLERIDGLHTVDAGPLAASRMVEAMTPVLIGINIRYRTHAGLAITGLEK